MPEPAAERLRHFRRPRQRPFSRHERGQAVILVNALTRWHDPLLRAALEGLGYRVETLPTPTKADFQVGREFGNNGMCNPAYFTVGALVNRLCRLRDDEGLSVEEIVQRYVYVTAGSCGPCRYGMYESEARLALANSGFEDFRVLTFQQTAGLGQSDEGGGIEYDLPFALALLNALALGDLLHELLCQTRPYETVPGAAEKALTAAAGRIAETLRRPSHPGWSVRIAARVAKPLAPDIPAEHLALLLVQVYPRSLEQLLRECAAEVRHAVEVDYTQPKPICRVIGEFFAQMTEGDGNFHMFSFLEANSAEVLPDPLTSWITYLLAMADFQIAEEGRLRKGFRLGVWRKRLRVRLALWLLEHVYERCRRALGGTAKPLTPQKRLAKLAHPHYNWRCSGGEGYMEVGKTIHSSEHAEGHMVLSLKPFGCLPSTQSDGAQAAVTGQRPDLVFLPIETSGEGDGNAHSRVLMALEDAKTKCLAEFDEAAAAEGCAIDDVRAFCKRHSRWRQPLHPTPKRKGIAGRAANFVVHAAYVMNRRNNHRE